MNDTVTGADETVKLESIYDNLYEVWEGLKEARRALDKDQSLTANQRRAERTKIDAQIAELRLQEASLNLNQIRALDQRGELDGILQNLNTFVAHTKEEIDRMRRATKIAGQVAKVLRAAAKAVGLIGKIVAAV